MVRLDHELVRGKNVPQDSAKQCMHLTLPEKTLDTFLNVTKMTFAYQLIE